MRTDSEILGLYDWRRLARGPHIERMREIQAHYEGDTIIIPLPEIDKKESPAVANLFTQGIDQHAMRIASTIPNVRFYPTRPGIKAAKELARRQRQTVLGWWEKNEMEIKLGRRARWLVAYSCSPVLIWPDKETGIPKWSLRDPLGTFPSSEDWDDMVPEDVIFVVQRTLAWLKQYNEEAFLLLRKQQNFKWTDHVTLLEYVDAEERVLLAVGERTSTSPARLVSTGQGTEALRAPGYALDNRQIIGTEEVVRLNRAPHYAGMCPAVVPGRITLSRPQGQFDGLIGLYQAQAKLMALEVNAVMRGVYPNVYYIRPEGGAGNIITEADGLRGIMGEVEGGSIQVVTENPAYMTPVLIDRLERNQRVTARIPSEFGGESQTNVRTGRRGEAVLSSTVDFDTQEAQRVLARSLHHENERAMAIAKGDLGSRQVSMFVGSKGVQGLAKYAGRELFKEEAYHLVRYAFPGQDINSQAIRIAQKVGVGLLSKREGRELDPDVEDAERSRDEVTIEALELALLTGIQQMASQGMFPPDDVARLIELIDTNQLELADAVHKVQREAQERQATQVPEGAPEAQPGIAQPGAGAEMSTIGEPEPSIENLESTLLSLIRPQNAARGLRQ